MRRERAQEGERARRAVVARAEEDRGVLCRLGRGTRAESRGDGEANALPADPTLNGSDRRVGDDAMSRFTRLESLEVEQLIHRFDELFEGVSARLRIVAACLTSGATQA